MCIIVFNWNPAGAEPLLLLANRDEAHCRLTAPLAQWQDWPRVHAGRDLEAGGSWLGLAPQGRFAALTNIRAQEPEQQRSRGELVSRYLATTVPPHDYIQEAATQTKQFNGFNLLVGDRQHLWFLHSRQPQPQLLSAGIYALCNASLDTPWPKLTRLRTAFSRLQGANDATLFALMRDSWRPEDRQLPDTGVGLVLERMLSSIFIVDEHYGTRATSLLRIGTDYARLTERSYAADASVMGQVQLEVL